MGSLKFKNFILRNPPKKRPKLAKNGFFEMKKVCFNTGWVTNTGTSEYAVIVVLCGKLVYWLDHAVNISQIKSKMRNYVPNLTLNINEF